MASRARPTREELIAAAEAGCFTMSLASLLEEQGTPAADIQTNARVRLEQTPEGFRITRITLQTVGHVPGVDEARFIELAEQAKATCPVSLALAGTEIVLDASLNRSTPHRACLLSADVRWCAHATRQPRPGRFWSPGSQAPETK